MTATPADTQLTPIEYAWHLTAQLMNRLTGRPYYPPSLYHADMWHQHRRLTFTPQARNQCFAFIHTGQFLPHDELETYGQELDALALYRQQRQRRLDALTDNIPDARDALLENIPRD